MTTTRRSFVAGFAALAAAPLLSAGVRAAPQKPLIIVYKSRYCGCCGGWAEHMKTNGFDVKVVEVADATPQRERLGVPAALASCHTAETQGYAIEGHVPASDVRRLLLERTPVRGLAVPAMVSGSPGMNGAPVPYEVLSFDSGGAYRVFARH